MNKVKSLFALAVAFVLGLVGQASAAFNSSATLTDITTDIDSRMTGVEGLMYGAALLGIGIFFVRIIINVLKGGVRLGTGR